ncbi:S9 family peptidase [Corallincola luteus]|uniref:S9 family peptidase n=1 Tax=Corallincola luteus TaxID=1775177 RepID=A0ABY2ANE0_9GAMM|nr:prolyl oligopeptidase family serine peptidase [Corallincola luteus]TCI04709.1 S9 family peptidase [Corallincola luteus]
MNKGVIIGLSIVLSACASTTPESDSSNTLAPPSKVTQAAPPTLSSGAPLTLEQIMAHPDWMGNSPVSPHWDSNSKQIYYQQKIAGSEQYQLLQHSLTETGNGQIIPLGEQYKVGHSTGVTNADNSHRAYIWQGNLLLETLSDGKITVLTQSSEQDAAPQWLNSGLLAFQRGSNYFFVDIHTGHIRQLTDLRLEEQPEAVPEPADHIAREQHKLIAYVALKQQRAAEKEAHQKAQQAADPTSSVSPVYLGKDQRIVASSLSPNGDKIILVLQAVQSPMEGNIMPNYITDDGRIESVKVRARVHDEVAPQNQFVLLDLSNNEIEKLDTSLLPGLGDDVLAAVRKENQQRYGDDYQPPEEDKGRNLSLIDDWYWSQSAIQWNNSGSEVALMLTTWDNKDRWLTRLDWQNKRLDSVHHLRDEAWINYKFNSFGWLNTRDDLYFLSEQSGYSQLYLVTPGKRAKALTKGEFEVDEITLTKDDGYIYFQANVKHPGIYEIYRVALTNGKVEALTNLAGNTHYLLSPDESQLLLTHSKLSQPNELYLQAAKAGAKARRLTHTVSKAFSDYPWTIPDVVAVPSNHTEQPIYAKVYYPKGYDASKANKYPAVIFNHGAGYLQNSDLGFSGYFREFMFHSMLAQQGYVVMDMDYRASAGYGRDWRTAIYRDMGRPETEDLADGVAWMTTHANVDKQRVGTYGGSYGGFMTFMALFTQPDLFQCGSALRPVSDWAHYNYGYTSNILNTPQIDPLAYERSSPIYYAEGLTKPLLINAPMVDDNVFFQDVVRLVQRLIELEKEDFETAIYPVEPHGFRQPSSWLNEYRRIYHLFGECLATK